MKKSRYQMTNRGRKAGVATIRNQMKALILGDDE